MEDIVLIGMGGHAKGVVDTIERQKRYHVIGFIEQQGEQSKAYKNYKVIGFDSDLGFLYNRGVKNAFITIGYLGNSQVRKNLYEKVKLIGYHLPVIIDDTAAVAKDTHIDEGSYVGKNAIINADSHIGKMCIINNGAVVEHDCMIGEYSHIAVGAVVCGMSHIKKQCFVGANASVMQGITVGANTIIGAGAVVINNVASNCTVVGIPAKVIE